MRYSVQTDWDQYYGEPFWASRFTRSYTARRLVGLMRKHCGVSNPEILEYGGGNSCFYPAIRRALDPALFTVVDNNAKGVDLFAETARRHGGGRAILGDVLQPCPEDRKADIVFSTGLIEHFSEEDTRRAVLTHFESVRPGGLVILTFPTPTWLYRLIRSQAERLGRWAFPDERPLAIPEVVQAVPDGAAILETGVLWPLLLTQGFVAAKTGRQQSAAT